MQAVVYQLLPELSEEEYEALKADIAATGIQVPIEVDEEGNVLDGYHRLRAARELGIPEESIPKMVRAGLSEQEKREHVLRLNLLRRQLTREQKRAIVLELRREGWTQTRIAQLLGVSQATVHYWLAEIADQEETASLPDRIVDSMGRRQAASKPHRRFDWPEVTEPPAPELLAEGEMDGQADGGTEEPILSVEPEVEPATAEPEATEGFGTIDEPGAVTVEGEDVAEGRVEAATDTAQGPVESGPAEDVIKTDNVTPAPEPSPPPRGRVPLQVVKAQPRWSYFWQCQPSPLWASAGKLTEEEYEMAVAFEAALNVLRYTYQGEHSRKVLRAWRRWKAEQGEEQAPRQAWRLLEAVARYLRSTLGISRRFGQG